MAAAVAAALTLSGRAQNAPAGGTPTFGVDRSWPRPLPNKWQLGPVSGVSVDRQDHVWIIQRADPVKQAGGVPAPPIIEFDPDGNVVQTWGGPGAGYEWPEQVHGITVDEKDRVWVSGNGDKDAQILTFTRTGKFLLQIGHQGHNGGSNDTANLGRSTQMRFDAAANELFVSDGEMNENHRVIVFNADTGAYKRHWGAYGKRPDDSAVVARFDPAAPPPTQFSGAVHCLHIDHDGVVYVCDRGNNRFQMFRKDGTFIKEVFVARDTRGAGSVWDIEFSPDQQFMYLADGGNQKIWILRRATQEVLSSFGGPGQEAGLFATSLHDIAVDSKGNLYTGEAATGGRIQKFSPQR